MAMPSARMPSSKSPNAGVGSCAATALSANAGGPGAVARVAVASAAAASAIIGQPNWRGLPALLQVTTIASAMPRAASSERTSPVRR
jgi:hypothetical protein